MNARIILPILLPVLPVATHAQSGGISEPPLVVYGKVIHVSQGSTYQVFDGSLSMTLENDGRQANQVAKSTQLGPINGGTQFSYRLEFPQKNLPGTEELETTLAIGSADTTFFLRGVSINGIDAAPLDPASTRLVSKYETRGREHRIDLLVSLPHEDHDGDGLPDWWEKMHGLNPLFAGDASSDADGDGIDALGEFAGGTDPNSSNTAPTVIASTVHAPAGGTAGLSVTIVDSDTAPSDLDLTIDSVPAGLTLRDSSGVLSLPSTLTYADVLAGKIVIDTAFGTPDRTIPMTVTDTTGANTPIAFEFTLKVFSPANQSGPQPAVWLEPSALAAPVTEWIDTSPHQRDAYQPTPADQPAGNGTGAIFDGSGQFLYLDDRLLALSEFNAFFAFQADALTSSDQVLFNGGGLELRVGGSDDPQHASSLLARRNGQLIEGPAIPFGSGAQVSVSGGANPSVLSFSGGVLFASAATSDNLPPAFATVGASQTIFDSAASRFFGGTIQEVLIYDSALDAAQRSRLEDYQLSRWTGLVVWDSRNATAPQSLTGHPGVRNALNGGWGDDVLVGAEFSDILRGGPGSDRLTGNGGPDRFQIMPGQGDDTISDFSEGQADVLDLTPIFAGVSGTPDRFLNFRTGIVRNGSGPPTVNSILEIDYDGGLDEVNQSVTFEGLALSNTDLPRLVGSGAIQLCGPMYPTAITITASENSLTETTTTRTVTLTRSGNLDNTLTVDLSFVGSAAIDVDYVLTGASGTGAIRTLSFAPGEAELHLGLTPVQDTFEDPEIIQVALLPSPLVTDPPAEPLMLTLDNAPAVTVEVLRRHAERLGAVPALVLFHRTGDLSTPLDVSLQFTGTAENGLDYLPISPLLTFPAGVATVEVEVTPTAISPIRDRAMAAQLSVVPDQDRFALASPWSGSILIVDGIEGDHARTFASFRAEHFPGDPATDEDLGNADHDGDLLNTLGEYVFGTDPNLANPAPEISIQNFTSDGFVQIHLITASGLTDAAIELQFSADLSAWAPVADDFTISYHWLEDGRLKRIYRSRLTANNLNQSGYYRAFVSRTPVVDLEATAASAFGAADQPLLATAGPVWAPSPDGAQLDAPELDESQSSHFSSFVTGPFTAAFEWHSDAGHLLTVTLDGVEIASASDTGGWTPVAVNSLEDRVHELVWRIERLAAPDSTEPEALRNLAISQP